MSYVIGTFQKVGDKYNGTFHTVGLNSTVNIVPTEATSEKAPDFRVFAGKAEIGAGWSKTSQNQRAYISVSMDGPTLPAPISASLVESDKEPGTYRLLWDRHKPEKPAV